VPVAAEFAYRFTAADLELDPSYFATDRTHVAFRGATAWGEQSRFSFHVTSRDWQESDQVLAGLIKDFGSSSDAVVSIGGRGEFDGMMTGPFRRARVEGAFSGEDLRAWDTKWGAASGHIVYEDDYVAVTNGVVRLGDSKSAPTVGFRSWLRVRTSATRSTPSFASRGAISRACATRSKSTSTRCRAACPASST